MSVLDYLQLFKTVPHQIPQKAELFFKEKPG